jgi:large subunit ribosomal protein L4
MTTLDLRTQDGGVAGSVELNDSIFGLEPNIHVLHQVVTAQLAARRSGSASTKTRAEVRGGGAKPYAQKVNKKMIQLALNSALSDRAQSERLVVVDAWKFATPKTKDALQAIEALELVGKLLIVVDEQDQIAARSFRNLPNVQLVQRNELNAYDILCCDWLVFTQATLPGSEA